MTQNILGAEEFALPLGGRLFVVPTAARDVVAIEGSIVGGPNMLPLNEREIPDLMADLLDAGTAHKSKNKIRESLASRGISLSFSASGDRTCFSGQCFPEDLEHLFRVVVECLSKAHFPLPEIVTAKTRAQGEIAEVKTSTMTRAGIVLSRMLYEPTHVNYADTLETVEKHISSIERKDLLHFQKRIGQGGLILAITGDIDTNKARAIAQSAFHKLEKGMSIPPPKQKNKKLPMADEKLIPIPDKANIDVLYGAALPLVKKDKLFLPLIALTDMLGGGFVSHLMQTIRERDGLAYAVYAQLQGFADGVDGYLRIWATFSPARYEESVTKLRAEVREFFARGLTEEALAKKKDEITGSYLVSLSTARGLAKTLHTLAADGRDFSYLTEYPNLIRAVSLSEIQKAAELIPLSKLSLASAGTFRNH